MKVGVLALQGAFREHRKILENLGCEVLEVRKPEQLDEVDGLVIPGGESTTIGKLLGDFSIKEPLTKKVAQGFPIYGTCTGLIVLAKDIADSNQQRLGVMDIRAKRNAFGRQVDSFEAEMSIPEIGPEPLKAVFIRAPYIEKAEDNVQVLAKIEDKIVVARQGNLLVTAFHPELTNDLRIHKYFLEIVNNYTLTK
jgi:pyridoxal 5'-phosphate synthase pdxT subunit